MKQAERPRMAATLPMLYFLATLVVYGYARILPTVDCDPPCANNGLCFPSQVGAHVCFCQQPWGGNSCSDHIQLQQADDDGDAQDEQAADDATPVADDASTEGTEPVTALTGLQSSVKLADDASDDDATTDSDSGTSSPTSGDNGISVASENGHVVPPAANGAELALSAATGVGSEAAVASVAGSTELASDNSEGMDAADPTPTSDGQDDDMLHKVLSHEEQIDDEISTLTTRVEAYRHDTSAEAGLSVTSVVTDTGNSLTDLPEPPVPLRFPVKVREAPPRFPSSAVSRSATHTRRVGGRGSHGRTAVAGAGKRSNARAATAAAARQGDPAAATGASSVQVKLYQSEVDASLSAHDVQFNLWYSLCGTMPCPLHIEMEDIQVKSVAQMIEAIIVPSKPEASSEEIMLTLRTQVEDPDSKLRHQFPNLVESQCDVRLADSPGLNTPVPPTASPTAPPQTITGTVAPEGKTEEEILADEAAKSEAAAHTGAAGGAAQASAQAAKSGGDPGAAAAAAADAGGPPPPPAKEVPPPMSTTMACIMNLAAQYFIVFTIFQFIRTYNNLNGIETNNIQECVKQATETVAFAPMLCILYIGTRMRALQLTQGHGSPQPWVQTCMLLCAYAVLVQCIMVLMVPLLLGSKESEGGDEEQKGGAGRIIAMCLTAIRYGALIALYGGAAGVCVGVIVMTPEDCMEDKEKAKTLWEHGPPPVSAALACTLNLTLQFFAVYLALIILKTIGQFAEGTPAFTTIEKKFWAGVNCVQNAAATVEFAPMLCVLFIGARMRALQIDPVNGEPQPWAKTWFYISSYALLGQTILVLLTPVLAFFAVKGNTKSEYQYDMKGPAAAGATAVRYILVACVFSGAAAVIYSLFEIKSKTGPTPAVSPAMMCATILTVQFFTIYLIVFILETLRGFTKFKFNAFWASMQTTKATVQFCPMLCVLFIGVRMRAQEVVPGGTPQGWAQDAMYLCTYALLVQLCMCLALPLFAAAPPEKDDDGNVIPAPKPGIFARLMAGLLEVLKYVALFALYGGVVVVCVSAFVITKSKANGKGSLYFTDPNPANNYYPKVPPLSTTMLCIINLSVQYFVVYSALIIVRKFNDAMGVSNAKSKIVGILEQAEATVQYAPMACVLFLGVRMRSQQLTANKGAPPPWVQTCMLVAAYCILTQLILVIVAGLLMPDDKPEGTDALTDAAASASNPAEAAAEAAVNKTMGLIATGLTVVRYIAMLGLYAAVIGVLVGAFTMTPETCMPKDPEAAKELWKDKGPPPVSPAVGNTMNLTLQFFAVYLGFNIAMTVHEVLKTKVWYIGPVKDKVLLIKETCKIATGTVQFAPMLCILFITARLRALQIDPKAGNPQKWAQMCMYACSYLVLVQAVLVLLTMIPALGAKAVTDENGEVSVQMSGVPGYIVTALGFLALLGMYACAGAICVSILIITDKDGEKPPMAPAVLCVLCLVLQFFCVYILFWTFQTLVKFSGPLGEKIQGIFKVGYDLTGSMKVCCAFCPMLAILFMGARMRATEVVAGTPYAGIHTSPPGYMQDAMFISTFAVLLQILLCLLQKVPFKPLQMVLGFLSMLALVMLYAGIIILCMGLFMMTPEICDGSGSQLKPVLPFLFPKAATAFLFQLHHALSHKVA